MIDVSAEQLLVNRSTFTLRMGVAGLPLTQFWTHMLAAHRVRQGEKLPSGSGYDMVCRASAHSADHIGGKKIKALMASVKKSGFKEDAVAYPLGQGLYELYGGHHRAVVAAVLGKSLPLLLRCLNPLDSGSVSLSGVMTAYKKVRQVEKLGERTTYNALRGHRSVRASIDRLRMIYRAVIDCRGHSVLDVGCNDGYFGVALGAHAFDPTFVEAVPAYCGVVRAKLSAADINGKIINSDFDTFKPKGHYTVVLYTDVFYHTVRRKGLKKARAQFRKVCSLATERVIFAPGRWDKLLPYGYTEAMMWGDVRAMRKRIRLLGIDDDPHYGREIFCLE